MALFSTTLEPHADLLSSNPSGLYARKFTLASGQKVIRGTVLGRITIGAELVLSLAAASDGSEVPFGVAATDGDATAGDDSPPATVDIDAYISGSFNEHELVLGAGHTVDSIREGLRDKGIYLETPLKRYP